MIEVVGEALIDAHLDGSTLRAHVGGGPFNAAVGLGRLGVPVTFREPLSADGLGDLLFDALVRAGVDCHEIDRVDEPTPLAVVASGSADVDYTFYLEGTAFERIGQRRKPTRAVAATLVGSLAIALEPPGESVVEYALAGAARGALVVDPNVRPKVIADAEAFRRRFERLATAASVVKLSRVDAEWLYPACAPDDAAGRLLALGALCVVVTDGANGARAWTRHVAARCVAPSVTVVDTIGAGDAFTAGFVARLWRHRLLAPERIATLREAELIEALEYGAAAGAAQCERASAWGPSLADIELAKGG